MNSRRGLVADVITSSHVDGPGNRFVVFLQGCNLDCLACHNPHTIGRLPTAGARWMETAELLDEIRTAEPFISGVTVSGGEATVQWRFVVDLFDALASDPELSHLTRFVDTNGEATPAIWDALAPTMDAAMVDLKAIDPDVHAFLTGRPNERILHSIEHLRAIDKLHEVRLLIVPGVNDRNDQLAATATWLVTIDPAIRVKVLGFRHHGTRKAAEPFRDADAETLQRTVDILVQHGVRRDAVTTSWTPS